MAIAQNDPSPGARCPETFRSLVREWPHSDDMVLEGSGRKCAVRCPRCELTALIDAWERELPYHCGIAQTKWIRERMLGAKEQGR